MNYQDKVKKTNICSDMAEKRMDSRYIPSSAFSWKSKISSNRFA